MPEPEPAPEPEPEPRPEPKRFEPQTRRRNRPVRNLPARTKPRRRGGLGWGLATVMGALVIAVLSFGREQLVSFYPPAGDVYAALGFSPAEREPGDGLELREIVPSRAEEDGVAYLVLDGRVVNVTDEVIDIPEMSAVLRNAENVALQQWTFRVDVAALQPGESTVFNTRLAAPADGAADVKIEFVGSEIGN